MASRWGASSWTASSTWESDHLDQWVEWAWTWAWKVSGTTCSPASVRPIATQRGNICRANQGITCLTEGYGAWQRDSLTSWRQQPTANPSVHLQDPTTFYAADICNVEAFHDRLQPSTMYPATVTATHRRSNLVQLIRPLPLSWQTPASSLVGTWLCPHCHCPLTFTWIPPLKVIAIASIDDTRETHCVLCLLPLANAAPGDIFSALWQTKETFCEEHSTLWDDGIGPRRSQCLYLTGHWQRKCGALKKYSGLKNGRRESKRKEI